MKILKQLLFIALISGGSLIASLSDKEKHDLIYSSGLPTTSIDQIQRNLSRLQKHGHLSAANKVQTILDTRRGAQSADTKSDQQIAAALADIKQQLELDKKIDQLAQQLEQSKQQAKVPSTTKLPTFEEINKYSQDDMYRLFGLQPGVTHAELNKISRHEINKRYKALLTEMAAVPAEQPTYAELVGHPTKSPDEIANEYIDSMKARIAATQKVEAFYEKLIKDLW